MTEPLTAEERLQLAVYREEHKADVAAAIIERLEDENRALKAELLRLCGPVCERDGKRAVEHTHRNGYCRAPNGDYRHANCAEHPPTPSIEKWLRERSDR